MSDVSMPNMLTKELPALLSLVLQPYFHAAPHRCSAELLHLFLAFIVSETSLSCGKSGLQCLALKQPSSEWALSADHHLRQRLHSRLSQHEFHTLILRYCVQGEANFRKPLSITQRVWLD